MRRYWWLLTISAGLGIGLVGGLVWWQNTQHRFSGIVLSPAVAAPDFTLWGGTGEPMTLSALQGHWVLLAYGYTSCPDVCPATLSTLKRAREQLGPAAEQVQVVFVSVDPERDTPDLVQRYVGHFDANMIGLTGTPEMVARAAQPYGVEYKPVEVDSAVGYLVSHTAFVYVIDPQGQWRLTIPFGVKAAEIAADLNYLMTLEAQ